MLRQGAQGFESLPLRHSRIRCLAYQQMKRILIFYTSVGLGHKIIAENIGYHLTKAGFEVRLSDILEVQSGFLVDFGTWLHQLVNKYFPFIWKFLYNSKGFNKLTLRWRIPLAAKNSERAAKAIADFNPDLVIATQTTGSAIVSYLKEQGVYKNKFAIAFSDYHLHPYWLYDQADLYLANIEEQKTEMIQQGIPEKKIVVAGMTLRPLPEIDTQAVRQKLSLSPTDQVVLMASGSLGTGMSPQKLLVFINSLEQKNPHARVIIVTGKNTQLLAQLTPLVKQTRALVFGYYAPMAELYSIANIFITKPGGLSVAESLAWGIPLLITHWLPGQEELNYYYLKQNKLIMSEGLGVKHDQLAVIASEELISQNFKNSLSQNSVRKQLVQENRLGQAIIQAVSQLLK